jgi:hypothetical protein
LPGRTVSGVRLTSAYADIDAEEDDGGQLTPGGLTMWLAAVPLSGREHVQVRHVYDTTMTIHGGSIRWMYDLSESRDRP